MSEHPFVVFTPSGKRGRFPTGTSVLDAARSIGVDLDSVCGGRGLCGRCQVEAGTGHFAKFGIESAPGHLSPPGEKEARYAARRGLAEGRRLGCSALIEGDVVIDVPPESQVHRQVVRKRAEARDYTIDPAIRLHYVEVAEPDMHNPSSDFERLTDALGAQWGLDDLTSDLHVLQDLQRALRDGEWSATVAVHRLTRIVALWPGFHEQAYGAAFDIGSTTIACHLAEISSGTVVASAGRMNPQIRFGEDLMSRVSYVMMNPGGEAELTEAVRGAVNALIGEVADEAGVARSDILNAAFVGNPIMHHLLLGIDPTELGGAPFALAASGGLTLPASDIDLDVNPGARVYVLPCIAGHVGADAAGVVLSEAPHRADETVLVVDVGTNAEIVLGNRERLLAASSPTGPAFEGAQIAAGQRAAPGAIERVRIDRDTLEARVRVIGCELWSDEEGFQEATAATGVTGICGSGIIEALAEMYLAGILLADGTIAGAAQAQTKRIVEEGRTFRYLLHPGEPAISIHQNDVRAIQLAKAALMAGARLLMDRFDITTVDRIVLTGAFGSHIDPLYAMVLGMIPDCPLEKVSAAGNAAGTGALIALLDCAA
ncbi:MAG: ASKHA domain-containing protein, partial [Rhodospirillaceae bacterium]|nr:ASKHA domain-containing protein [Rhodospirillaceae bacterium]